MRHCTGNTFPMRFQLRGSGGGIRNSLQDTTWTCARGFCLHAKPYPVLWVQYKCPHSRLDCLYTSADRGYEDLQSYLAAAGSLSILLFHWAGVLMRWCAFMLLFVAVSLAPAVIIDRIAVIIGNSIVKDSDIDRNLRVTSFLNREPLNFNNAARKAAAHRLIDQIFIRREIQLGDYPVATPQETNRQLDRLKEERYKSKPAFEQALHRYGLTELELRTEF